MSFDALRSLFGRDVFISYARKDGVAYAAALANRISTAKFTVAIDQWGSRSGKEIPLGLRNSLRRASCLVLIGSPEAVVSEAVEWELRNFPHDSRDVIPISFEGAIERSPVAGILDGATISRETLASLTAGQPSEACVARVLGSMQFTRQQVRVTRWFAALTLVSAVLIGAALWLMRSAQDAETRRDRALEEKQSVEAQMPALLEKAASAAEDERAARNNAKAAETAASQAQAQERQAVQARRVALSQEEAAQARILLAENNPRAAQHALGAIEQAPSDAAQSAVRAVAAAPRQLYALPHPFPVVAAAFSEDGKTLAGASWDGDIALWNLETRKLLRTLVAIKTPGVKFHVDSMAFANKGQRLLVSTRDMVLAVRQAHLIDTVRDVRLRVLPGGVPKDAMLPDASMVWIDEGNHLCRVALSTGETLGCDQRFALEPSGDVAIGHAAMGGAGTRLLQIIAAPTVEHRTILGTQRESVGDARIRVWKVDASAAPTSIDVDPLKMEQWLTSNGDYRFARKTLYDFNLRSDSLRYESHCRGRDTYKTIVSPDELRVAVVCKGYDIVHGWNEHESHTDRFDRFFNGHKATVYDAAFSPDGKLLATAAHDKTIRLWPVDPLTPLLNCPLGYGTAPFLSYQQPEPGRLNSQGGTGGADAEWLREVKGLRCDRYPEARSNGFASFDPVRRRMLTRLAGAVLFQGEQTLIPADREHSFQQAALSADGQTAAVYTWDRPRQGEDPPVSIRMLDIRSRRTQGIALGLARDHRLFALDVKGQYLLSHGEHTWSVWRRSGGKPILEGWADGGVATLQFELDGQHLLLVDKLGQWWRYRLSDGSRKLLNAGPAKQELLSARFDSTNQRLATFDPEGTITIYRLGSSNRVLHNIDSRSTEIYDLRFSPDGNLLAVLSGHDVLQIFDTDSGQLMARQTMGTVLGPAGLHFSPEGGYLTVATQNEFSVLACGFCGPFPRVLAGVRGLRE